MDDCYNEGVAVKSRIYYRQGDWPEDQTVLTDHVNFIKDYPAFWGYWAKDEPYWCEVWDAENPNHPPGEGKWTDTPYGDYSIAGLTASRQYVESLDPDHPVMINWSPYYQMTTYHGMTMAGYQDRLSCGRVYTMDTYPVGTSQIDLDGVVNVTLV